MREFKYDYVKQKYGENAKLCYMDTDSSVVPVKTHYIYRGVAEDAETGFEALKFEDDRPLPIGKNKNSDWTNER